ncbi:MAG: GMC oxidoreductase, partial [Sphingomonadales bacterium]
HPVRRRSNLTVMTGAQVTKILFEDTRAIGVRMVRKGQTRDIIAAREIILSAGAIASPKILMLSGVGPAAQLKDHGISPVVDLPGVGENLQEHPGIMMSEHVSQPTLNMETGPLKMIRHGLDFLLRGRGPATASIGHAVAFVRVADDAPAPDVQISFTPIAFDFTESGIALYHRSAVGMAVNVCRPETRGTITLGSADPMAAPVINHSLVGSDRDMQTMIRGCRMTRRIMESPAFARFSEGERWPGKDVQTDSEWEAFIRQNAFLMYHPVGTARMGVDAMAVVDARLRVRGVTGLRVADASIMPTVPSANTNAPAIMVGEKASDLILADA